MSFDVQPPSAPLRKTHCVIGFADLVESVRVFAADENAAIARWRRFAELARNEWVPAAGGRLVRTDGDGLLMEFPDTTRAVAAAFALHAGLSSLNAQEPGAEPMALRVGLHVADVTFDAYEAYGIGVNLAQRITSLAQPGQTLVSATARSGLVDGVHADVEDLGDRYVKHLDEPVRTFRVAPVGASTRAPASVATSARADIRPTLAVIPFQAVAPDPPHDALGFAMADDVIGAISRHPGLRVVSRLSATAFRDTSHDWTRLRPLLGAGFVLSGCYYVSGGRVRLTLELAETSAGHVLWAESARAEVQAMFEGRDALVPHVVDQVARHMPRMRWCGCAACRWTRSSRTRSTWAPKA